MQSLTQVLHQLVWMSLPGHMPCCEMREQDSTKRLLGHPCTDSCQQNEVFPEGIVQQPSQQPAGEHATARSGTCRLTTYLPGCCRAIMGAIRPCLASSVQGPLGPSGNQALPKTRTSSPGMQAHYASGPMTTTGHMAALLAPWALQG